MDLHTLRAAGLALFLAALASQASGGDLHRQSPDLSLPFELVSGFEVVAHGQIGELNGLRFILDTGSSSSVIDRRVAERLGLRGRPGSVINFDRNLAVEWADVSDLRIGPIRVADMSVMVASLPDISGFAENADGIIGLDVLSRARKITIDYERRRISFELDEGRGNEPSAMKTFVVPVTIQGTPVRLLVDTGLRYLLLYKDRLRSALPQLRTSGESRDALLGRLPATLVNLPGVEISGSDAMTPALLIEGPGKSDAGEVDGYLGPASLHARRLELDFVAKTLRWK